jgi:hypothetical protein
MFCVLGVLCTGNLSAEPLNQFLARMRTATGAPYRAHLQAVFRIHDGGIIHIIHADTADVRFYARECSDSVCSGTSFDGRRAYHINFNGTALPDNSGYVSALLGARTVASFAFLDPNFRRTGRIVDGGLTLYNGQHYHELLVTAAGAHPMVVLVDPNTNLVAAVSDAVVGGPVLTYDDYRHVGSFMLPFAMHRSGQLVESYDSRAAVAAPFDPPHGLVPTLFPAAGALQTDPSSLVPVGTCTIASIPVRCLIDTGNSGLSMSLELAEQLDLPAVGSYEANGLGNYATEIVRAGPVTVGNAVFPEAEYVVLHDIHRYGYDLILGADIFANARVEIDPAAHTVRFGVPAARGSSTLPLTFESSVPEVEVQLGNVLANLAIDTGDTSNVNLGHAFYERHTDLFSPSQQNEVAGVGGTSIEEIGRIPTVSIGLYHLSSQPIGTTQLLAGTGDGHLGAAFLGHFKMQLDYEAATVTLTPQAGDTAVKHT